MLNPIYSKKIELRKSAIQGIGAFAIENISKGEIIFVKNGHILSVNDRYYKKTIECDWPINSYYIIGAKTEEEYNEVKLSINHSCNPNCGLLGLNTGVAMRDIKYNEEITFDYAMLDNEEYNFKCNCKCENCRKIITGFDWKNKELQKRYIGYFSNNIQEKIESESY